MCISAKIVRNSRTSALARISSGAKYSSLKISPGSYGYVQKALMAT
ncbi:MAG: hypothetical protein ACI9A2_003142, partial [Halioglobus sp.]